MAAYAKPYRFSPQEYLDWERQQETKHEYLDGEIVAMAGSSWEHGVIVGNLQGELHAALKGKTCRAVTQDLRVETLECNRYYYPDVTIVCGNPQFTDAVLDTINNPTVLIEVLSNSTERKDRGEKLQCYQTLASLELYVLVSQHSPTVEIFKRQENGWLYSLLKGWDAVLNLEAIGITISFADIYAGILFVENAGEEENTP